MSKTYKGFVIETYGLNFSPIKDFYVYPEGKEEQAELYEGMTLEQVETMIDISVN